MKLKYVYSFSLFIGYVAFVSIGSLFMLAQIGILGKGLILILIGGLIYLPLYAVSNLTQFLILKYPKHIKVAFFLPIIIVWLVVSFAVITNNMDDFFWKVLIFSQVIVSFIAYKLYKK